MAKYRILTFKILFWHSNWCVISYFDIQNPILKFEIGPNIVFWYSKSYFDIRTEAQYCILTFKSYFDTLSGAEYRILTCKILFWHSNWGRISHFDIQNPILTFEIRPDIVFWCSKFYFDIRNRAEYRILIFKFLFWHSNWGRISYFDIQNPILTFDLGSNIVFWHQNPILTFQIGPNFVFWYSKSYFDIRFGPNVVFWHSKSYFDIRNRTEYHILIFKILFWHSNWGRILYFDIQIPIWTFELGPNIVFWHSKFNFDIRTGTEYRILTFKILFWHLISGRISYFDIQNPILTFELGRNIVF